MHTDGIEYTLLGKKAYFYPSSILPVSDSYMRIDEIQLENFRGFPNNTFPLHPQFNVIAGKNGSGKTAILEGLNVAIGSFLLGIRDATSRHIKPDDVRIQTTEHGAEEQYPVRVQARGFLHEAPFEWARSINTRGGRTNTRDATALRDAARRLDEQVRADQPVSLPLLAFYSTGRLFKERRDQVTEGQPPVASRFRGYYNCLEATSSFSDFLRWFRGKELAAIQREQQRERNGLQGGTPLLGLQLIKQTITDNLPGCTRVYYDMDPDGEGLKVELETGETLPFDFLSDGTRNLFALLADLAYRCILLNPQHGLEATTQTEGVVLIDELDLHLHPEWQRNIVESLRTTFPKVQFVCTSHSPFIIQATNDGELIDLEPGGYAVGGGSDKSLEDIAEDIQEVENPQWSKKRQAMYEAAEEYYQLLQQEPENEAEKQRLKIELDRLTTPFADNIAYVAFLEQERLAQEGD